MTTKTCMQRTPRGLRRLPHDVPDATETGYARCSHCGAEVYVGRGALSPEALQRLEYEMARNDRQGR